MQLQHLIRQAGEQQQRGLHREAVASYRAALRLQPDDPALHYELGSLYLALNEAQQARQSYLAALRLAPGHPQILLQLGNVAAAQGRHADAADYFRASLQSDPGQPAACYNLGNALREQGLAAEAEQAYRAALRLDPGDADTHNNLGNVLREQGRLMDAIASYQAALARNPRLDHARMHLLHQRMHVCDWHGLKQEIAHIRARVRDEPRAQISPFAFLSLPGTSAAEQLRCARQWTHNRYASLLAESRAPLPPRDAAARLKLGYLSADFRQHPLAWLATELIELHDRRQFEVYAYSYGEDDRSPARRRWEAAFDQFRDIRALSLHEAAARIRADGIDILVDLTGYTQGSRSGVMAPRPAPINVNWLGFPGSMGAEFVDYLIGDGYLTPPAAAAGYSEALVRLPYCYQPNDRQRPQATPPTRADCGLPASGLVFCCFNQTFKITPQVFDIWIELLNNNPGSVLWLLECNRWAKANLQREAAARGGDPARLVFAPRVPIAQHLARHACADLMLDTLPYNAHTTTSDALWMGLPVLTCSGNTFASRVAGSLLHAAGLPELVTHSLADYAARAQQLAGDPQALAALRGKVAMVRGSALFDTPRFARQLESAYQAMWQRHAAGLPPQPLEVTASA